MKEVIATLRAAAPNPDRVGRPHAERRDARVKETLPPAIRSTDPVTPRRLDLERDKIECPKCETEVATRCLKVFACACGCVKLHLDFSSDEVFKQALHHALKKLAEPDIKWVRD